MRGRPGSGLKDELLLQIAKIVSSVQSLSSLGLSDVLISFKRAGNLVFEIQSPLIFRCWNTVRSVRNHACGSDGGWMNSSVGGMFSSTL